MRLCALCAAIAMLCAAPALHAAPSEEAPDWFRAFQYTGRTVVLRGCAECKGEPDDVCEVRGGAQVQRLDEYARERWPAPGRVKLLRSKADPDCAVPAAGPKGLFGPRGALELAAIRIARAAPSAALLERFQVGPAIQGWPRAPSRRGAEQRSASRPQRSALRAALVCWPSEQGWPQPAAPGTDGRASLDERNPCEWWLLAVKPDAGEPDLGGASFPLGGRPQPFAYGEARWARAFEPGLALEETLFLGERAARVPPEPARASAAPTLAVSPAPAAAAPPAPGSAPGRCGETARARSATLDRFDQWDAQIRGSGRRSLDRVSWTLDAAAWAGHCQELDVLRAALEQQLACALELQGRCIGAVGPGLEAR